MNPSERVVGGILSRNNREMGLFNSFKLWVCGIIVSEQDDISFGVRFDELLDMISVHHAQNPILKYPQNLLILPVSNLPSEWIQL